MTCAEFQKALPYIIDTGGSPEQEEHLNSCPVCRDLVMDLRYIAEVAKLLVPMEEPPARVWEGLQQAIDAESEGKPARPRGRLLSRSRSNATP
jgi:predicted anti-sigma-YlaC factor YlaD